MKDMIVGVKFDDSPISKEYYFISYIELKIGDMVVVDTKNGFLIATVTNLTGKIPNGKVAKEVVDVIDFTAFNERKEKSEKIKKLKSDMNNRVKELQDIYLYETLSEKDPELGEMLKQLKELM